MEKKKRVVRGEEKVTYYDLQSPMVIWVTMLLVP